ncbi:MAG TPA: hypothetical protein VJY15_18215 [Candidatus Acidoferrum sp.]|nr:hypothetical protein [Candidatus Acidoferrum sp.]
MNSDPQGQQEGPLKKPLVYALIGIVVVAAYFVFLLLSRHEAAREFERRNTELLDEQHRAEDRLTLEQLGGSQFAIRALYVDPSVIRRGESAQICYDVANAKSVSLDPPVAAVWPSHTRCFEVSPKRTTTYTLTINDGTGKTATKTLQVRVR